jgi:hypothetical protein
MVSGWNFTIYTIIVLAAEFWYAVRAYESPVE